MLYKLAYAMGARHALQKFGMEDYEQPASAHDVGEEGLPPEGILDENEEIPPELLALMADNPEALDMESMPGEEGGPDSAEDFAAFANSDDTAEVADPTAEKIPPPGTLEEKSPAWSSQTSLDSGDAGTRNHQMGVPTPGAV